jgi:hypothetical protein
LILEFAFKVLKKKKKKKKKERVEKQNALSRRTLYLVVVSIRFLWKQNGRNQFQSQIDDHHYVEK